MATNYFWLPTNWQPNPFNRHLCGDEKFWIANPTIKSFSSPHQGCHHVHPFVTTQ
jgi:hypothetical protein